MYAVIKSGGKQYQVRPGDTIRVEKIDAGEGAVVNLDQVLMIADGAAVAVGAPVLKGATVPAKVKAHGRGRKIKILKFRRRKQSLKRMGHRQAYTELEITGINAPPQGGAEE